MAMAPSPGLLGSRAVTVPTIAALAGIPAECPAVNGSLVPPGGGGSVNRMMYLMPRIECLAQVRKTLSHC